MEEYINYDNNIIEIILENKVVKIKFEDIEDIKINRDKYILIYYENDKIPVLKHISKLENREIEEYNKKIDGIINVNRFKI